MNTFRESPTGTLRLNVPTIVASKILPPIATRFLALHPGITLEVTANDAFIDVLAAGFLALGIGKGDRVGIWSPNRVEWLLTQFATARIGAVLVNINPAYRLAELEYALNKVSCLVSLSFTSVRLCRLYR